MLHIKSGNTDVYLGYLFYACPKTRSMNILTSANEALLQKELYTHTIDCIHLYIIFYPG